MAFTPVNRFEAALVLAEEGKGSVADLMKLFVDSELAVPSAGEVMQDGSGFQPLLFPKEKSQMMACFSDKSRIGEFAAMAPYCLVMKGKDILRRMPPGYGLVINPGNSIGFDIAPEGIASIVNDFIKG
jgi:hypothetical protein